MSIRRKLFGRQRNSFLVNDSSGENYQENKNLCNLLNLRKSAMQTNKKSPVSRGLFFLFS
jgi:hypothetical protein